MEKYTKTRKNSRQPQDISEICCHIICIYVNSISVAQMYVSAFLDLTTRFSVTAIQKGHNFLDKQVL